MNIASFTTKGGSRYTINIMKGAKTLYGVQFPSGMRVVQGKTQVRKALQSIEGKINRRRV